MPEDDEFGSGSDSAPDNVIPFPGMRPSPKLAEAWARELKSQNEKLKVNDEFISPLQCSKEIVRRRGLPVFPWPQAWPNLGRRCRAYAGDVTIVTGPTGAGKTSFAIQIALASTGAGVPVLWCPLELDPTAISERIVANMHGVHTRAVKEFWSRERIDHSLAAVDDMWRFVPRVMDTDAQLALVQRGIALAFRIYRIKPLVVIDYLGKLAALARDIRLATIQAAECVRKLASDGECFVLMLAQPSRSKNQALTGKIDHESAADTSGSAAESGEAENAAAVEINLEVFKADDAQILDARWNVAKSRHTGEEGKVGATFSKPGGVWSELGHIPPHPLQVKAAEEAEKKDKHRTAPARSAPEIRAELNQARAETADVTRRARLLEAITKAGIDGMPPHLIRSVAGAGRGAQVFAVLHELEAMGLVERGPKGWRATSR